MKKIFGRGLCFLASFALVVAVSTVAFKVTHPPVAHAQAITTSSELVGYAWSDNIGWISFSGTNNGVTYGVNEDSSGNLTGYAWSDSIGWIQFGGLSGFPTNSGSTESNATINNGVMHGWVRACAGTVNAGDSQTSPTQVGDCDSMTSRTDGWDGWISLDGSNYGVSYNATDQQYEGWAWGSDVVGWINFITGSSTPSTGTTTNPGNGCSGVCSVGTTQPALTCSGSLNSSTNQITWTATVASGTTPYVFTWTPGSGTTGASSTNANSNISTWTTNAITPASSPATYSISVGATSAGTTVSGASCPSIPGPTSTTQPGGMCSPIPSGSTLCSGSSVPNTGTVAGTLVASCPSSGTVPECEFTCPSNSHIFGSGASAQCILNQTIQEQ